MAKRNRLLEWLNSRPQVCEVCGSDNDLVVGSTHRKTLRPSVRCVDHVAGLCKVFSVGFAVSARGPLAEEVLSMARAAGCTNVPALRISDGSSPPSRDDAAWFLAHPTRTHRIRSPFIGEVPSAEKWTDGTLIVRQVSPGRRIRVFVRSDKPIPDDDNVLSVVFDMSKSTVVKVDEAIARAACMRVVGGLQ